VFGVGKRKRKYFARGQASLMSDFLHSRRLPPFDSIKLSISFMDSRGANVMKRLGLITTALDTMTPTSLPRSVNQVVG
jgi:hypothetical protein